MNSSSLHCFAFIDARKSDESRKKIFLKKYRDDHGGQKKPIVESGWGIIEYFRMKAQTKWIKLLSDKSHAFLVT